MSVLNITKTHIIFMKVEFQKKSQVNITADLGHIIRYENNMTRYL